MLALPPKQDIIPTSPQDTVSTRYYATNPIVRHIYRKRLTISISLLEPHMFRNLLEIGCGSGILTPTLRRYAKNIVSMDLHNRLPQVNSKIPGNYVKADLLNLPFKRKFDCIVCLSVLEHIEDLPRALTQIRRVLKTNGLAVFGFPADSKLVAAWFRLKNSPALHEHVSSEKQILTELQKHFTIDARKHLHLGPVKLYTAVRCS